MSKREDFIAAVNIFRTASRSISTEQRKGLLQQAVQYGLSTHEADQILKASGLIVGERINYLEVLGFSIEELKDQRQASIAMRVDVAHHKLYIESLRAGGLPRLDGRTQEQWRTVLNQARDTLKDVQKRTEYLATLLPNNDLSEISAYDIPSPENENQNSVPTSFKCPSNDLQR